MEPIQFLQVPSTADLLADMKFWQTKVAQTMGVSLEMLGHPARPMTATEARSLQALLDQKHGINRPRPTPATEV